MQKLTTLKGLSLSSGNLDLLFITDNPEIYPKMLNVRSRVIGRQKSHCCALSIPIYLKVTYLSYSGYVGI